MLNRYKSCSYTTLEAENVREISSGSFASVLDIMDNIIMSTFNIFVLVFLLLNLSMFLIAVLDE